MVGDWCVSFAFVYVLKTTMNMEDPEEFKECCISSCKRSNYIDDVDFFKFPKSQVLFKAWIDFCKQDAKGDDPEFGESYICSVSIAFIFGVSWSPFLIHFSVRSSQVLTVSGFLLVGTSVLLSRWNTIYREKAACQPLSFVR